MANDKSRIWLGVCIMLGLVFLGAMLPGAVTKFKSYDRIVTVRGLCEKEVPADQVIWPIVCKVAGNDLSSSYKELERQQSLIRNFLLRGGLTEDEITPGAVEVSDQNTESYSSDRRMRFILKGVITVCSKDVDKVRSLIASQNELVEKGIVMVNDWENQIQYSFTSLNDIKPAMVEEATKNARAVGEKFAQDSGSRLGKIKTASQGMFSISDRDSNTPWIKEVRVVNSVTYYIVD